MKRLFYISLVTFFVLSFSGAIQVPAQVGFGFGQNKVHYKNFDWSVFRTEHFDVYYYSEAEETAKDAARMAERGYDYLSEVLDHKFKKRIPLLLYASLNDFQQTNVVQGMLGDGTRGVTESLKKRVVLPFTGSYRDFNHVLVHELVHAFQFDILFNRDNIRSGGRFDPPLWFMEGMAEYLSNGMDNVTRMWVRDGLNNDKLLTVKELNNTFDIRVYRIGQSLWNHIGETYGKKKIGFIMKTAIRIGDLETTFKKQIGKDFKGLTEEWHAAVKTQVTPPEELELLSPVDIAEQITKMESFYHRINVTPSVSPDGNMVAYVSNKNLNDEIHLLKRENDGTYTSQGVIKGGQSKKFESLHILDTSIGWSRDGKYIAFVSKSGKDDLLYIMDPIKKEIIRQLNFDRMNGLLSPSFSPDGKQISFVGMYGGRSNLYTVELETGIQKQLTDDRYAVLHPQWSPDGKKILFATDRGEGTDIDKLLFGDYDLALYSLESGEIKILTNIDGNTTSPQWASDNKSIIFISDHQGIQNIYKLDLEKGDISRITALQNGISGITESTPALSWSRDGKTLVFSSFIKEGWQLFRMELPETEILFVEDLNGNNFDTNGHSETVAADSIINRDSNWLPQLPEPNNLYREYNLADEDSVESLGYGTKLRLDGIFMGANIGGFLGSVGGAQFLFSDMLGNKNLIFSTGVRFNDILNSDIGLTYFNQSKRLNYGISAYQQSFAFATFASFNTLGFVQQTYRTINVFALYPFSRFARIELNAGVTSVNQALVVETVSSSGDRDREKQNIGRLEFGQVGASLVFDNTMYGLIGPIGGSRSRFSIQSAVNDFKFTSIFGDYRRYFNINVRSSIAWRLMAAASYGRDAQFFRIGGPFTFRGADYGELIGPYTIVQNLEYRFPLFPFLPYNYDFFSAVAFFDAAAAWGFNAPGFIKTTFQPFSNSGFKDLNGAIGLGARLRLGYLSLRFDLGWPTDLRNVGDLQTFFSIGTDF